MSRKLVDWLARVLEMGAQRDKSLTDFLSELDANSSQAAYMKKAIHRIREYLEDDLDPSALVTLSYRYLYYYFSRCFSSH